MRGGVTGFVCTGFAAGRCGDWNGGRVAGAGRPIMQPDSIAAAAAMPAYT
ncbi:hypothetical protein [Sandarakinorhabdus sp.]|jgi:hypothetical protein|nr:hypothetical protein [Sandarakinorhabdus sp.]